MFRRMDDIRYWTFSNIPVRKILDLLQRDPDTSEKVGVIPRPLAKKVTPASLLDPILTPVSTSHTTVSLALAPSTMRHGCGPKRSRALEDAS